MIYDLDTMAGAREFTADLCIVGAGPAGITVTKELIGSGLSVILVESGGFREDPATHNLYAGTSVGHPLRMTEGRHRVFGGSATRWSGRCALLDPLDFEVRPWLNMSGWPVSFDEMLPYYNRAKIVSNFGGLWVPDTVPKATIVPHLPELTLGKLKAFVWRTASPRMTLRSQLPLGVRNAFDYGKAYRKLLARDRSTQVILHANMTSFGPSENGANVKTIAVSSLNGRTATIRAKAFVLSCGGIENARLLLNAPEVMLDRINAHDNVGRHLMQHPRGCIGTIEASAEIAWHLQHIFNHFFRPARVPVQYEFGVALTEEAQREHRLLNASAVFVYQGDDQSPWEAARRIVRAARERNIQKALLRDLRILVPGAPLLLPNVVRKYFFGRQLMYRRPIIRVDIDLEQAPNRDSRISLAAERDPFGSFRAQADWRISDDERRTAFFFSQFLADELARLELGSLKPAAWLSGHTALTEQDLHGNYHFIGTTRMSDDPCAGVVDSNCLVYGTENLYCTGASVFSTGGHANPTLTITALAIRLADHLRQRLLPLGADVWPAYCPALEVTGLMRSMAARPAEATFRPARPPAPPGAA
jgi:choline dehydrogenase-like flavoprotein